MIRECTPTEGSIRKTRLIYRKRLLGLASQKFISDIANDAMAYTKLRQQGQQTKDKKGAMLRVGSPIKESEFLESRMKSVRF